MDTATLPIRPTPLPTIERTEPWINGLLEIDFNRFLSRIYFISPKIITQETFLNPNTVFLETSKKIYSPKVRRLKV